MYSPGYHFCFCLIILVMSLLTSMVLSRFADSGVILSCRHPKSYELRNTDGKNEIRKGRVWMQSKLFTHWKPCKTCTVSYSGLFTCSTCDFFLYMIHLFAHVGHVVSFFQIWFSYINNYFSRDHKMLHLLTWVHFCNFPRFSMWLHITHAITNLWLHVCDVCDFFFPLWI